MIKIKWYRFYDTVIRNLKSSVKMEMKKFRMEKTNAARGGHRDSNFELFRIILMILIIAHHYTVNSGLLLLFDFNHITGNMIFLQIFGMFGKMAINCFTLITGYFMIQSTITLKKFLKIYLQIKYYYLIFYIIFWITGYEPFSIHELLRTCFSVAYEAGNLYTGTYVMFFLFIPFLNLLAKELNKNLYQKFLVLLITYFTVFSTFTAQDTFNFTGWMMTVYLIGGYIRLYPCRLFNSIVFAAAAMIGSLLAMVTGIISTDIIFVKFGFADYYYLFMDSHKILAVTSSVSAFLLFKNLKIRQNKFINKMAASTFGILLIHTNSNTMRRFLWIDLFQNTLFYDSEYLILHAVGAVFLVYGACLVIDLLRIRFLEFWYCRYNN